MKRIIILILVFTFLFPASVCATEENSVFDTIEAEDFWFEEAAAFTGDFKVKSAYLTDYLTGTVLYAKNEQERADLAIIIEEVLKQRYTGVKNEEGVYITPAFPKLIYVLEYVPMD